MHVDFLNPKTNTWPAMQQRNLHLNSSLTFQDNLSFQETLLLSFSTGTHTNQKFAPYFTLFLLRKELGSSLEFTGSHTKRKISLHLISYLTLSKQLQQWRNSLPYGPTPKRKKTLSNSLPLILLGPATRKGKSFLQERFYSYFSPQEP